MKEPTVDVIFIKEFVVNRRWSFSVGQRASLPPEMASDLAAKGFVKPSQSVSLFMHRDPTPPQPADPPGGDTWTTS